MANDTDWPWKFLPACIDTLSRNKKKPFKSSLALRKWTVIVGFGVLAKKKKKVLVYHLRIKILV